jgi:hypothetical protein
MLLRDLSVRTVTGDARFRVNIHSGPDYCPECDCCATARGLPLFRAEVEIDFSTALVWPVFRRLWGLHGTLLRLEGGRVDAERVHQ